MADRPILFRGPLVRAIFDDRKTVTRRLIQHEHAPNPGLVWQDCDCRDIHPNDTPCVVCAARFGPARFEAGDTLWVKEKWRPAGRASTPTGVYIDYSAGCETRVMACPDPAKWGAVDPGPMRSPLYMPRWASRLTLHVVSVRAERLQDITPEDAFAEGIEVPDVFGDVDSYNRKSVPGGVAVSSAYDTEAVRLFRDLWDGINGKRPGASWDANPWVWRVEFKRADKTHV